MPGAVWGSAWRKRTALFLFGFFLEGFSFSDYWVISPTKVLWWCPLSFCGSSPQLDVAPGEALVE